MFSQQSRNLHNQWTVQQELGHTLTHNPIIYTSKMYNVDLNIKIAVQMKSHAANWHHMILLVVFQVIWGELADETKVVCNCLVLVLHFNSCLHDITGEAWSL